MAEKNNQTRTIAKIEAPQMPVKLRKEDIKKYICPDADETDLLMFVRHCQRRQLDPFDREAYLIKYSKKDPASIITNYRVFLERASTFPDYNGFRAGVIVQKGHETIEREGTLVLTGETLLGGWCEVYRKGRDYPTRITVMLKEYIQTRWDGGKRVPQANWKSEGGMQATMIRKTAVGQGHHDAYPIEFQGMNTEAELPTGGAELSQVPIPRETDPDAPLPSDKGDIAEGEYEPVSDATPEAEGDKPQAAPKCVTCGADLTVENVMYLDEQGIAENKCFKCLGLIESVAYIDVVAQQKRQESLVGEEKVKRLNTLVARLTKFKGKEYARETAIAAKAKVAGRANVKTTELTQMQAEQLEIILEEHVRGAKEEQST